MTAFRGSLRNCLRAIRAHPKPFYVYLLYYPGGEAFYVGAGSGARISEHDRQARNDKRRRSSKLGVMRQMLKRGVEIEYSIAGWFDNWEEALRRECLLIEELGRADQGSGPLLNQTSGGEGSPTKSEAAIAKISARARAQWAEPEHRAKHSELMKQKWADAAFRSRCTEAQRDAFKRPGFKALRSKASKTVWSSTRRRVALSETLKKRWAENRKTRIEIIQQATSSPEYRARISELSRRRWADPEYRARMILARRSRKPKARESGDKA